MHDIEKILGCVVEEGGAPGRPLNAPLLIQHPHRHNVSILTQMQ